VDTVGGDYGWHGSARRRERLDRMPNLFQSSRAGRPPTKPVRAELDRALAQRAATLGFLPQNQAFDSLHRDAHFVALVQRVGLWKRRLTP
jgi:hypothetical protein